MEDMRSDLRELKEDFKNGMSEIRTLADMTGKYGASQAVVNDVTAKALESITEKVERHADTLADHTSTLRLLVDKVMSK